ncbi:MAG: hypothetical protein RL154_448 [Pseudomonadota bacterium]|jgi:heme oxygenase
MLRDRLKNLTKPFHDEVEQNSTGGSVMEKTITKNEYINMLSSFYSYLKPFEDVLLIHKDMFLQRGIDVTKRFRSHLLENNLATLGVQLPEIKNYNHKEFEQLVGTFYVYEGSTMGGMALYKMLGEIEFAKDARSYFLPYGENTMTYWKEFTNFLVALSDEKDFNESKAILAACETFLNLKSGK